MTSMYECDVPGCDWRNPNWRYGFAEAGATWAEHAATGPCLVGSRPGSYDAECLCDEFEGAVSWLS